MYISAPIHGVGTFNGLIVQRRCPHWVYPQKAHFLSEGNLTPHDLSCGEMYCEYCRRRVKTSKQVAFGLCLGAAGVNILAALTEHAACALLKCTPQQAYDLYDKPEVGYNICF